VIFSFNLFLIYIIFYAHFILLLSKNKRNPLSIQTVMEIKKKFTRVFNERFPGFDTDVHGLTVEEMDDGRKRYSVDCVQR